MGVGSEVVGRAGPWPPMDFQTWYKYSRYRLKSAIFRPFLLIFGFFSVGSPEKFSSDALGLGAKFFARNRAEVF